MLSKKEFPIIDAELHQPWVEQTPNKSMPSVLRKDSKRYLSVLAAPGQVGELPCGEWAALNDHEMGNLFNGRRDARRHPAFVCGCVVHSGDDK